MAVNFGFDGENATGMKPTGLRNYRDTFAIKSPLRISDSEVETNSSVSEESNLPELSRAEERAIRLSGAQFEPIQNPTKHTDMDDDKYQDISSWKPSEDLTRVIEGKSGPKYTRTWDDDDLEISQDESHPPITIIPPQARESTPDSVVATGTFMINRIRPDNQRPVVEFDRTNLQEHAGQNGLLGSTLNSSSTISTVGLGVSMRHVVGDINRANTRANNHVVSPDNVHLDHDETDGPSERRDGTGKKEKGMSMLVPKLIMCIVAVMIVLAGIVALIVKFKKSDYEGPTAKIIPNPIPYLDCPDVYVKLGENVNFTCKYDLKHEYRKSLVAYKKFRIEAVDKIISDEYLSFKLNVTNTTFLNMLFTSDGWKARCSTEGRYVIHLYDENDNSLHESNVTIKLKSSMVNTTFEQHLSDCPDDGEVKTYFKATCSMAGDCNSYEPSIVRTGYRGQQSLNHLMTCQRNYTDETGYSVHCNADVPDDIIVDQSHLRCRMTSSEKRLERAFVLPQCSMTPSCLTVTAGSPYPFNCSAKSTHVDRLKNASCNFDALRNCLQPGRKVFNLYKTFDGDLSCKKTSTSVSVCRLSWCADYRYILKNVQPGQLICGGEFIEQEYKPPATTTTPQQPLKR